MPFGNGTGPAGMGPMTGRAAGYCAGYNMPGYMNNAVPRRGGAGFGFGGRGRFGGGRGYRNRFWATGLPAWARGGAYPPPYGAPGYGAAPYPPYAAPGYAADPDAAKASELEYLKDQLKAMQEDTEAVQKRISELEAEVGDDSES